MNTIIHPSERVLNWSPSRPDHRDRPIEEFLELPSWRSLPASTDLRGLFPPALDQGRLGSCVSNATAGATQFTMKKMGSKVFLALPSRLFLYYNTRLIEGTQGRDSGCYVRDALKSLNSDGVCSEIEWPYVESQVLTRPSKISYTHATKEKSVNYGAVDNTQADQIKAVLAVGYPIIFGFTVYDSFLSAQVAKTGIVPMPGPNEKDQGGHSMLIGGHDDPTNIYRCRNSWSTTWGQNGWCEMPQDYLENQNMASDFWVVMQVTR